MEILTSQQDPSGAIAHMYASIASDIALKILGGAGIGFISVMLASLLVAQLNYLSPPPGTSNVRIRSFALTDHSRVDPFAPGHNEPRRVMLSLFEPAHCQQTVALPYMPPKTAAAVDALYAPLGVPNGTVETFRLQICPEDSPVETQAAYPLLLFSPGLWSPRLGYSNLLQWISSLGFTVV